LEEKKEAGSLIIPRSVKWRRKGHFNSVDPQLQFSISLVVEADGGAWSAGPAPSRQQPAWSSPHGLVYSREAKTTLWRQSFSVIRRIKEKDIFEYNTFNNS